METNIGPDLFQYYIRGVSELLSRDDFPPSSSTTSNENSASLFCNIAGYGLSDFKKTRLNAMLRQSVVALTQEVDEMLDPVISMRRLRDLLAPTNSCASYQDEKWKNETENRAQKRLKIPSSSYLNNNPQNVSPVSCTLTGEGSPNKSLTGFNNRECAKFSTESTNHIESKPLCVDYSKQANYKDTNESFLGSISREGKAHIEINDDLQVLLVNKGPLVEEKMEKHSADISAQLGRMEEKLEELLDIIISNCRPMTVVEKHKLRGMIQKLHPKNLDRVVEIIQRRKPSESQTCCYINVDLQQEDDLTLWRIYFYVTAAENAKKL